MDSKGPVYTLNNECQDCYKCVRRCPVKAIRIQDGHACVLPDRCIACGRCVAPCPSHAKRVRSDTERVRQALSSGKRIYVSLAPSWRASFSCNSRQMVATLLKTGFAGVSETALGAQEVSIETARQLNAMDKGLMISTACPVIVNYVRRYRPDMIPYLDPLGSPALTHAKMLKQTYGDDCTVEFIGPCVAKKAEADEHPELLYASLTFEELKVWWKENDIHVVADTDADGAFVPERACEGGLYPLDGGMNETIRRVGVKESVQLVPVCSFDLFADALKTVQPDALKQPLFIEALACDGGCVHGPCVAAAASDMNNMSRILRHVRNRDRVPNQARVVVDQAYTPKPVGQRSYSLEELRAALRRIGKYLPEDELNCAGCGYQTCKDMARALLDGDAEPAMCVSYMRKIATRKVAALLKSMPSAMVMVDKNLNILETNEAFIKMFAGNMRDIFLSDPQKMTGLPLKGLFNGGKLFATVLATGQEMHREGHKYNGKMYDIHLFPIEAAESVGAIITDMTNTQHDREGVARKARDVINKNIATVQQIACLLGEHIVETESILNTIANEYDSADGETTGGEQG